jgi:imidazolonepropionase-like amidohydrolase
MRRITRVVATSLWLIAAAPVAVGASRTPTQPGAAASVLATTAAPDDGVRPYVKIAAPAVLLRGVRVIDGTGAAPLENRNVLIVGDRIEAIGDSSITGPSGAQVLDLPGHSVLPGLVGMHDHLFHIARPNLQANGRSDPPLLAPEMAFSAPRLYLAAGVTTIRTTGSVEPYADLNLKRQIDAGHLPGPRMDVTSPYIGNHPLFPQMSELRSPEQARRMAAYWADEGVTSFKAYMYITRAQLKAAIDEAHRRGLKVTGHLCSVTYPEAVALGIDDLEHGFFVNTQFDPDKKPDACPDTAGGPTLAKMGADPASADALIDLLVQHQVAVTSTLPVFEQTVANRPALDPAHLEVMSPQAREAYLYARARRAAAAPEAREQAERAFKTGMALERRFVERGGLLIAGCDPTGSGGVVPGFSDHRELELLVEAGFTPVEAIRIASLNGAVYLGVADSLGSVEPGKLADLVVVRGDPSKRISDVRQVELVFKAGVGYDPAALLESVRGRFGQY